MRFRSSCFVLLFVATVPTATACRNGNAEPTVEAQAPQPAIPLPNKNGTFKFGVLGDFGTGDSKQYALAKRMKEVHDRFKYELVILVGDNLYGSERPQDFEKKFERPYKPLLDAGVKFYASLGNHDQREQKDYKLFNMGGKAYYTFDPQKGVRFFALESTYPEPEQIAWFEKEVSASGAEWKIPFFHHPLYSSGERHGSDLKLRATLEPMLLKNGVTVVFTGHDHMYERTKPQQGVTYFVVGSGGKLRAGGIDSGTGITARGFASDLAFLVAEIDGDKLNFQTVSRRGEVIDSGVIERRK